MNLHNMPVVPLKGLTVFPNMVISFPVGRKISLDAIEAAQEADEMVFLVTQKKTDDEPDVDNLSSIGTVCRIKQVLRLPANVTHVIVEGIERAYVVGINTNDGFYKSDADVIKEGSAEDYFGDINVQALMRLANEKFEAYTRLNSAMPPNEVMLTLVSSKTPGQLADAVTAGMNIDNSIKLKALETIDPVERLKYIIDILTREIDILGLKNEIDQKVRASMEESQREYYLREQLKVISTQLGDKDGVQAIKDGLMKKADEKKLPEYVYKAVAEECDRMIKIPVSSPEFNVSRTYIESILKLPWSERSIICLAGPPGVGKTSVAKSIARAAGRKYVRMSLGGVRDEAEIRGHRRTYVGAMWGRILNAMKEAATVNPLMLLDEVDKLGVSFNGDPSSALLEVLDPEQNSTFVDHYLDMPYDLSDVLFICTANDVSKIPGPLRDRMEIIQIPGYTPDEKKNIAEKYLYPKQLEKSGLTGRQLSVSSRAVERIIERYTREAGVRQLERTIGKLCRIAVVDILSEKYSHAAVTERNLSRFLGPEKFTDFKANDKPMVGVVRGLAWTSVGGETLEIEANAMRGSGKTELTGNMGNVMKESARAAIAYIRSASGRFSLDEDFYKNTDIHIHIPEGAVPKDGPSAGITMALAVLSALTGAAVKNNVAMTGEITITGRVLPIGGLKEKVLAAKQAGIDTIIIPKDNEASLKELPDNIKRGIKFIFASCMEDVITNAVAEGEKVWK